MGAFGSQVTFVLRGDTFLRREDDEIRERFTAAYNRRFDVRFNTRVLSARREGAEVVLEVQDQTGETAELRADELLVATGRIPNGDRLDVAAGGIDTGPAGYVTTDDQLRGPPPRACGRWAT